ncbi:MAG: CerR family C-terminal domain-containing protein [Bdellovibrionales bacterium]|jgi:AcrR family transcriptional regulator
MKKAVAASSTAARGRLLSAALKIFALYGFEGASTRQITKEAKVNIAAIPYYFRDKEGLYKATLEHIAGIIRKNITDEALSFRQTAESKNLSVEESRALLHGLVEKFAFFLLGDKASANIARIFLREQMDPTGDFPVLYDSLMKPVHEMLTRLVARLAKLPFPSEQATLCAHALLGQLVVFKTHREAAFRRLNWKKYGAKEKEKIVKTVIRNADYVLDAYAKNFSARLP